MDDHQPASRRRVHTAADPLAEQQNYQLHYRRQQPSQQQQQQQQQHVLESDDPSDGTTTTLSLTDGVLRDGHGQLIQLITINSDGQQEYIDHTTLTGGDIISGQLANGMLVNFSADDLQQPADGQHEQIVIDTFDGSDDDTEIIELYHGDPQRPPDPHDYHLQSDDPDAGRSGGILQYANTSMAIASIVDGAAANGANVIVPNAYCSRAAKPRHATASQMPPPPLTPFRRGQRSAAVEHSHPVTEPLQKPALIVQRAPSTNGATFGNIVTLATNSTSATPLPHKKRHTTVGRSPPTRPQLAAPAPVPAPSAPSAAAPSPFQCQLCSLPCASQLEFFRHLQSHYETTPGPTEAAASEAAVKEEVMLFDGDHAADAAADQQATNATIGMDVDVVIARPKRDRRATHKNAQPQTKKSRKHIDTHVLPPAESGPDSTPAEHPPSVALSDEQPQHLIEFGDTLAHLIDHQVQSELDDNGAQAEQQNNVMLIRLNDATGDGGHMADNGEPDCDVMDIYTLHEVDEADAEDEGHGATIGDETAVEGEWFEEGEMSEEIMFDVAVDAEDIGNDIEVNQQQIDADNCHTANATDSAIKPEPSDVGAATSDAIADTATARPDAPAKRKRTYNKKTTLASQMDCFEEIIAVVPAAADGDDASANGRRGTAKRGTGATTSSPADGAADAAGAAGAPAGRPVTTKSFKCRLCDKVCKTKNSLHYHFLLHTGERPHQCDECGKGFFANSALKVHQRLHTGDKPYQCEVCSRAFRQWGDLRYHMSSLHSDEKNHQCEFCGKDFARRYSLVIHRRIHTGERNYKCEFCDKSFRASTYLQDHRRIHTGEKPFECEFCQKKFRVRGDLKRHWNIHTRKPKEEEMTLESLVLEATDNEGDEGLADAGDAGADQLEVVEIVEYGSDEFTIKAEPLEEGAPLLEISRVDEKVMTQPKTKSDAAQPRKGASGGRNKRANAANPSQ